MGPKKKEQQKMSLGAFLTDKAMGSWADEMEDMPVSDSRTGYGTERRTYSATTGTYGSGNVGGYSVREEVPLPDKPPYTVHLGNLSFDATTGDVSQFFANCECTNVRIIEDRMEMKPKGFGYAEFASPDGLKQALTLNGSQFQGRSIRISVAEPPKDRGDRPEPRDISDWSRKGPLPDLPSRGGNRRESDRGFGFDHGDGERRERFPEGDGKVRDLGNWERKGPLSPIPPPQRNQREGGRSRINDEGFRDRRSSPAAWGEGRQQGSQDGSRPPRREFQERPAVERPPTAAEQDNQWRTKMRPDPPASNSPEPSRAGSETSSSPAPGTTTGVSRPKLNLTKRTVPETISQSPSLVTGDVKASPFGAARPIDTAAKIREIEEKRLAAIKEKKEAELRQNEAKLEAAKAQKELEERKKLESLKSPETTQTNLAPKSRESPVSEKKLNGHPSNDKTAKPRDNVRDTRPKPSDAGAWRRSTNGPLLARDDIPKGPRATRGGGPGRSRGDGPRQNEDRSNRQNVNGNGPCVTQNLQAESEAKALEEDGWSTVSKPKKNHRGGNYGARFSAVVQ